MRIAALIVIGAALSGCSGPHPEVLGEELRPPESAGGPYLLVVKLANRSSGEGEVELTARLHPRGSKETAAEASQEVDLQPHEQVSVTIPLRPANAADYEPAVEAQYPPM
jgi:hypothetical protein